MPEMVLAAPWRAVAALLLLTALVGGSVLVVTATLRARRGIPTDIETATAQLQAAALRGAQAPPHPQVKSGPFWSAYCRLVCLCVATRAGAAYAGTHVCVAATAIVLGSPSLLLASIPLAALGALSDAVAGSEIAARRIVDRNDRSLRRAVLVCLLWNAIRQTPTPRAHSLA